MSVPLPVDADYSFVEINVENYFFCDKRDQPFALSFGDHYVVGTGFQQIRDATEFGSVAAHDPHPFKICPVIKPITGLGQTVARYRYFTFNQLGCLVPVIHALELDNDRFAMALTLTNRGGMPGTFSLQVPAIVVEDRFARRRVRKYLDPALYPEQTGNPAQQNWLFQILYQLLA